MRHKLPFAARWEIAEKDLRKLKDSKEDESLESKFISTKSTSGLKYLLEIYPNGDDEDNRGEIIIFFGLKLGDIKEVEAKYTVKVESANYCSDEIEVDFNEETNSCGVCHFDTVDLFDPEKKFIVDGKMILTIDGIFEYGSDYEDKINLFTAAMGTQLWKKDDTKDFLIITADGRGIMAHKFLLRARSPVFAAMFRSKMKESIENRIEIIDFSYEVIERAMMIIYEYTGRYQCSFKQVLGILQFFDKYDFRFHKDDLEEIMMDNISEFNVCRFMNCSIKSNAQKLQQKCEKFLMDAFTKKMPLAYLHELDKDIAAKIFQNYLYRDAKTA